jgi:hypothetical protein
MGWSGVENGELLRRAAGRTDVFVTMDRRLQHQQKVAELSYGVVLVRARLTGKRVAWVCVAAFIARRRSRPLAGFGQRRFCQ